MIIHSKLIYCHLCFFICYRVKWGKFLSYNMYLIGNICQRHRVSHAQSGDSSTSTSEILEIVLILMLGNL